MLLRKGITSSPLSTFAFFSLLLITLSPLQVQGANVLTTDDFSLCLNSDRLIIKKLHITYNRALNKVAFDVRGESVKEQKVRAELTVTTYGKKAYEGWFDPCGKQRINALCPVPKGPFAANGTVSVSHDYASMIPEIAFQVPDMDGMARLQLISMDDNKTLVCLESVIANGKTASHPAVSYVTASIAGAALVLSLLGGAGGTGGSGSGSASPNFGDVMFWFQSVATNGMLSVDYPPIYRSFAKNFAWSTGLITWTQMQKSIDNFRSATGGNTTDMSIEYLLNTNLVHTQGIDELASNKTKRDLSVYLFPRQASFSSNSTSTPPPPSGQENKVIHYVHGIEGYVEELKIPSANTFMTVLLIFCIVIASITVFVLLFKAILEVWALYASFPKSLAGFRKRYWSFLATTIIRLILILYGTWTLYCLYQFKRGDSWGANLLAGLTLAVFTVILGFFSARIFFIARQIRKEEGGTEALFQNKPYTRRYGFFYDQFKTNFWWIFVPLIAYAFAKAAFIALGDGHGLAQAAGQLVCEVLLLVLLLWSRPFNTKSGNVLNIIICVVRVLSVICLLVFVHELNIPPNAKVVTGLTLIVIQSSLTVALAILLVINAIVGMRKQNPHDKQRKEGEQKRETDDLALPEARQ